jgi:acetyl-CoA C-acetyltransferase
MAAAQVMSGQCALSVGGGVESMSRVPMGSSGGAWPADPAVAQGTRFVPQGVSADLIATLYGHSRADVDAVALTSQQRAGLAWAERRFDRSIVPVRDLNGVVVLDRDEHLRPETTADDLAKLQPAFAALGAAGFDAVAQLRYPGVEALRHVHTAGNSSGIVDGASAVLVGSREVGERLGLRPRARIRSFASVGSEPTIMLTGPADAARKALRRAGMAVGDIDLFEINEAFASVVLAWARETGADLDRTNPNGGAIALGHPLGATGAFLLTKALYELERSDTSSALISMCCGGGLGTGTIIERV